MRLITTAALFLICCLAFAPSASAGAMFAGWYLGLGGSNSGWGWSSDFGADPSQSVAPPYGFGLNYDIVGSTTPLNAADHPYAGETVQTSISSQYFGLGSSLLVDVAPAGSVEGQVDYIRIVDTVPPSTNYYGAVTSATAAGPLYFNGVPGSPSTIYYAYSWRITTDISGLDASFTYDIGVQGPHTNASVVPGDYSGSSFGFAYLDRGDGGVSQNGSGFVGPSVGFDVVAENTGFGRQTAGSATFEALLTFSASPITVAPPFDTVPEPATLTLLGFGLCGLAFLKRRRAPHA